MESHGVNIDSMSDDLLPSTIAGTSDSINELIFTNNSDHSGNNFSECSGKMAYNPNTMTYVSRRTYIEKAWEDKDIESLEQIYRAELKNLMVARVMVPFGDWTVKEPLIEDFKPFLHYFFYHMSDVMENIFFQDNSLLEGIEEENIFPLLLSLDYMEEATKVLNDKFTKNYFGTMNTQAEITLLHRALYCALTSYSIPLIFLCLFYMRWHEIQHSH